MYYKSLLTLLLLLSVSTLLHAEFPAEEIWSVEFDTTVTCLGPNWVEDGQTHFLVGLENQAVIVSDGEVVWESPILGVDGLPETVTAVNRFDFGVGDGAEIIVSTFQAWDWNGEEIEADTGKMYFFSGEDYEDVHVRTPFMHEFVADANWDGRRVSAIHLFSHMLQDTSKSLLTCNEYSDWGYFSRSNTRTGFVVFTDDESQVYYFDDEVGLTINSQVYNDGQDEHLLIATYYLWWSELGEFCEGFNKRCMIHILDSNAQVERSRTFGVTTSDNVYYSYGETKSQSNMHGMTIFDDVDGNPNLYVAYSDSVPRPRLARLSFDDLETEDEMFLPLDDLSDNKISIHHFPWGENGQGENMLTCIASDGRVIAIDPFEMVETERGAFRMNCYGTEVGNYDDDEQLELAYLSDRSLHLFDVTPLSTPIQRHYEPPTTYSITSAYPNPFNSKSVIEYTLPHAGRYALVVYDVNGAEITRLADEWRSAGQYQTVWDASGVGSGTYFVKLGVDGEFVTEAVQLIK